MRCQVKKKSLWASLIGGLTLLTLSWDAWRLLFFQAGLAKLLVALMVGASLFSLFSPLFWQSSAWLGQTLGKGFAWLGQTLGKGFAQLPERICRVKTTLLVKVLGLPLVALLASSNAYLPTGSPIHTFMDILIGLIFVTWLFPKVWKRSALWWGPIKYLARFILVWGCGLVLLFMWDAAFTISVVRSLIQPLGFYLPLHPLEFYRR